MNINVGDWFVERRSTGGYQVLQAKHVSAQTVTYWAASLARDLRTNRSRVVFVGPEAAARFAFTRLDSSRNLHQQEVRAALDRKTKRDETIICMAKEGA